ncbi:DUF2798 domain-containing protein [Cytobacillus gottheilii]|uniref:DUF2798 domain-containing protein n=1 Tax=Cytobacillus gottheilii TaxID=859144 RepID=UPI003CF11C0E
MPTTKKESVQFGLMMCFGMVLVMTFYNFYLNGTLGKMTFMDTAVNFAIGFIIALILDLYLVGPMAKRIAMKLTANTNKVIFKVLAISVCMVLGMAFFMSIYGVIMSSLHNGIADHIFMSYLAVFGKNLLMALPLQILIMGPLVRLIFIKFVKAEPAVRSV